MDVRHAHSRRTLRESLGHVFRERQIYVRSDNALRYIVVRPWQLIAAATVCVASLAWLSVSTFVFLYEAYEVSSARSRTERVQLMYDNRLATMQNAVERLNEKLMLDQDAYMDKVDGLRGEFETLLDRQRRLEVFFKQGWLPLRGTSDDADPTAAKAKPQSRQLRPALSSMYAGLEFRTKDEAEQPIRDVRAMFTDFAKAQLVLAARLVASGEAKAEALRTAVRKLHLDPGKVAASVALPNSAIGGPLLQVQQGRSPQDALDKKLLTAHEKFVESEKLRLALKRMPVVLPMKDGYRLTSGFGFRRDPFKDVLAMHTGVDLMSAYGAAIKATANGVVTRAEMSDAYGRVVDIRHDNGITTRYAHMSTMEVNEGDHVKRGQIVGRVGTSGRSTGPHLHYETRVNGKPIDPYEFVRVARNVLQKKER